MDRQPLSSSNIRSAGYDAEKRILEVEFASGSIYHYFDVPVQTFNSLLSASSPGKYFQSVVRRAGYEFVRVS